MRVGQVRRRATGAFFAVLTIAGACNLSAGPTTTTTSSTLASTTTTPSGSSTTTTTQPLGDRHQYGGEVLIGELEEPLTLNRYAPGGDSFIVSKIGQGYWTGVQDVDGANLELIPDVVVTLPTVANGGLVVNPDGTETVTYMIAPAAVWADGTPISGADFAFTYESIMNPEYATDKTGYEDIVSGSIVVGPKSFQYTMANPTLQVETMFSLILPRHVVEGTDLMSDWNDTMWVSGGPFVLEQWSRGEFITLTRNPNYWKSDPDTGQQLPYLDRVIFRFIPDATTLIAEFKARRIDVITPPADVATIQDLGALEGAAIDVASAGPWEQLSFQFGDGRLLRNPGSYNEHIEYRKAVAHAIDRQRIVDELYAGYADILDSYVAAYNPVMSLGAWSEYAYDPDRSRLFLTELCAKDGVDCAANPPAVVFTASAVDVRVQLSGILEPMFADAGIAYSVEIDPALIFFGNTLDFGYFDVADWAWVGSPGMASLVAIHAAWDPGGTPPNGLAFTRWGSSAVSGQEDSRYNQRASSVVDAATERFQVLVGLMERTVDERELIAYFNEAESILAEAVVFLPLYQTPDIGVVWADEIGGYQHNPTDAADTWNLGSWHRVDS
ncbi:MAG: ABC transporter substrate-binding protein [Actinomycetota bacterium]